MCEQPSRQFYGAEPLTGDGVEWRGRDAKIFGREKTPIESRIVGDEDAPDEMLRQFAGDLMKLRRVRHHRVADTGEMGDERRNWAARIDKRMKNVLHDRALYENGRDLRYAITGLCAPAGGLNIHHDERRIGEGCFLMPGRA